MQNSPATRVDAGILITSVESLLDIIIAVYAILICNNTTDKIKLVFLLFACSFLCDCISSAFYNFDMYVLQLNYLKISFFSSSMYHIPYLGALLLDFCAWTIILRNIKTHKIQIKPKILQYFPLCLVSTLFVLITLWQYTPIKQHILFAPSLIYDYIQFIFYATNIILVFLCAVMTKNTGIFIIACGYMISLATSLGIDFGMTARPFNDKNILEFGLVLGTIFMLYGIYEYKKTLIPPELVALNPSAIDQL